MKNFKKYVSCFILLLIDILIFAGQDSLNAKSFDKSDVYSKQDIEENIIYLNKTIDIEERYLSKLIKKHDVLQKKSPGLLKDRLVSGNSLRIIDTFIRSEYKKLNLEGQLKILELINTGNDKELNYAKEQSSYYKYMKDKEKQANEKIKQICNQYGPQIVDSHIRVLYDRTLDDLLKSEARK